MDGADITLRKNILAEWMKALQYLKPYWPIILICILILQIDNAYTIYFAEIQRSMIDAMTLQEEQTLYYYAKLALVLALAMFILLFVQRFMSSYTKSLITRDISAKLYDHMNRIAFPYLQKNRSSDMVMRATGDSGNMAGLTVDPLYELVSNIVLCVLAFGYMYNANATLAMISVATGPLLFIVGRLFDKQIYKKAKALQEQESEIRGGFQELIQGLTILKSYGVEQAFTNKILQKKERWNQSLMSLRMLQTAMSVTMEIVMNAVILTSTFLLCLSAIKGETTPGTIMAFFYLMIKLQMPFANLSMTLNGIYAGIASAERVSHVLDTPATYEEVNDKLNSFADRSASPLAVELKNVNVSHHIPIFGEDATQVQPKALIKNISMVVGTGETVAIVGHNGSGKSTVLRTIGGLVQVGEGELKLFGQSCDTDERADMCSYVPQTPYLFSELTIMENICVGMTDVPYEKVIYYAKIAQAHSFIEQLQHQYDTLIGDLEAGVSGGEMQRIAIVRALIREKPLLLLDEATSSLDNTTERLVMESLKEYAEQQMVTIVMVAHRAASIMHADRVVTMNDGALEHQDIIDEGMKQISQY